MLDTGTDAERGNQGFPHGIGGADDVIAMPLQCSTQWDGLGHIFDHGNGLERPPRGRRRHQRGRPGHRHRDRRRADRRPRRAARRRPGASAPTASCPTASPSPPSTSRRPSPRRARRRASAAATSLLVRTGRLARARREGWGDYAGGACPRPVVHHRRLAARHRDRRHRHRHLGLRGAAQRVRRRLPAAAPGRHPAHRAVPRRDVGPRRPRRRLRRRRRATTSGSPPPRCPSPAPSAPRSTRSPSSRSRHDACREQRPGRRRRRSPAPPPPSCSPQAGVAVDLVEIKPDVAALGSGITLQGNALRVLRQLGVWDAGAGGRATPSTSSASARPTRPAPLVAEIPDVKTGGPDLPADHGHAPARAGPHPRSTAPPRPASRSASARRSPSCTQDDDGVDVTFSDGSTGRYDLVVGADGVRSWTRRALGIDLETQVGRHGHLARLRPAPGQRHPHRPRTTAAPATSPATAPPARTRSTPTSSRTRRTAATLTPEEQLADDEASCPQAYHGPWDEIRETLTDPAAVNYTWFETHVLDRPVEPRPGRAHRRRRAHLPAHHRPGRAPGARGRRRPRRAAARSATRSTRTCGTPSPPAASSARRPSSTRPIQLGQWQLDHVQGDVPGLMRSHRRPRQPARLSTRPAPRNPR